MSLENTSRVTKAKGSSVKKVVAMGGKTNDFSLAKIVCNKYGNTEEQKKLLYDYYHLLVNTDYFNEYAFNFFIKGYSYKDLEREFGSKNYNNYIAKSVKDLFDDLGDDPLYMILYENPTDEQIVLLGNQIKRLIKNQKTIVNDGIKNMFTIDIESVAKIDLNYNRTIDDEVFKDVLEILKPYVKKYQDLMLNQLEPEHFGYVYYLLTTPNSNLIKEDIERKKLLKLTWALQ